MFRVFFSVVWTVTIVLIVIAKVFFCYFRSNYNITCHSKDFHLLFQSSCNIDCQVISSLQIAWDKFSACQWHFEERKWQIVHIVFLVLTSATDISILCFTCGLGRIFCKSIVSVRSLEELIIFLWFSFVLFSSETTCILQLVIHFTNTVYFLRDQTSFRAHRSKYSMYPQIIHMREHSVGIDRLNFLSFLFSRSEKK